MSVESEILFIFMLGLILLGPNQLHSLWAQVARAKAQFEEAKREFRSHLAAKVDAAYQEGKTYTSPELGASREPSSDLRYWNSESAREAHPAR